ncbi:MAG TPA: FeoA family protein [Fimbriimonas sp.]
MPLGEPARIVKLRLTGAERRRLLDMGLAPGTVVEGRLRSPLGDPVAYQVRGTLVSLRRRQAEMIDVERSAR